MSEIVDLLASVHLFRRLRLRELQQVADLLEVADYDRATYLCHQGEVGDRLFIILLGEASVWLTDVEGIERQVGQLGPGEHFGERTLFAPEIHDATVSVAPETRVLFLRRSVLTPFLEGYPAIRKALDLPGDLRDRLEAPRFDWMTPDEYTVFFGRKARWALLASEFVPAVLFLALIALGNLLGGLPTLSLALSLAAVVLGGALGLLKWLDWRNDYYTVTSKRIVHHESELPTLRVSINQAPLDRIQNVTLLKPNILARLLNLGTLAIQTAGGGATLFFRHLEAPDECQEIIFEELEQARSLAWVSERSAIREAIAEQLQSPEEAQLAPPEEVPVELPPRRYTSGDVTWDMGAAPQPSTETDTDAQPSLLGPIGRAIRALLPHFREQEGQIITWHKHPFILIRAIWLPAIVLLSTIAIGIWWAVSMTESFGSVVILVFVVSCISFAWFFWKYEDWRNDIYRMTASHIMDIDRLPLGLRESRRQAALEHIQNINVDIPNLTARLFNYGNVMIETAGATGDLIFEFVMKPRAIQAEIFQRIDAIKTQRQEQEQVQRREEMARWVAVYHQMQERDEI